MVTRRIGKESDMVRLPKAAEPLIASFSVAFTRPTFQRVTLLIIGAILALRHRTVTSILRTLGSLAKGHFSDFHRVLCCRIWSTWPLGRALAAMILELVPADQPVVVPVDDTAPQHKGKRVYGKARHHDACRSSRTHVVWIWGHKWVVLAINVKFPFAQRPWALPVLCALYRSEELNEQERRRHKTTIRLSMQLIATLIHWFPRRKFILVCDGGYGCHELARFCHRHRRHVTLISRFYPNANLYELPVPKKPAGKRTGRPRVKGRRLPKPKEVVEKSKARRFTVSWYGGGERKVELITGDGFWHKAKHSRGLVPVRWVFVHDKSGTHRDEYFFCTDPSLSAQQIVSWYTARWSIEVTFQELRAHLGLTTLRNWSKSSVLRTAPCLMGLFSVVSLIFARASRRNAPAVGSMPWYRKTEPTFSDAISAVRRLCWQEVLRSPANHVRVTKLPTRLKLMLLDHLCQPT
jgi:hypothetical protein